MAVGLLSGDALETATVVGELRLPRVGYDDEYRPLAGSYGGALRCGATMRAIGAEDPAPCRRRFLRYESRAGASADECREARRLMDWDASGGAPARRAALAWRGFPATARAGVYADEARRRRGTSPKGGSLSTFLARTVPRPTSPPPESEASLERWAGAVDDLLRARPRPGTTLEPRSLDAPGAGQEKGDSTSLQRECSSCARSGKSTYASRALREMIARPKISRNEWKTTEIGAFEVGNFAPFSCPGPAPRTSRGRRASTGSWWRS